MALTSSGRHWPVSGPRYGGAAQETSSAQTSEVSIQHSMVTRRENSAADRSAIVQASGFVNTDHLQLSNRVYTARLPPRYNSPNICKKQQRG